jgi:hypothetical protein
VLGLLLTVHRRSTNASMGRPYGYKRHKYVVVQNKKGERKEHVGLGTPPPRLRSRAAHEGTCNVCSFLHGFLVLIMHVQESICAIRVRLYNADKD